MSHKLELTDDLLQSHYTDVSKFMFIHTLYGLISNVETT